MRSFCYIFIFITCVFMAYPTEYKYPVGSIDNGTIVFYIHQKSSSDIALIEWNRHNNTHTSCLWSLFNPAGVQLLPDNSGFSFIYNSRLYIKSFNKRSAKAIDFDEPIFNINGLHWLDNHTCYCSAQHNDRFALFELSDDGTSECLVSFNDKDCMYPQKIDDNVFYIERSKSLISSDFCYNIMQYSAHTLIEWGTIPIIFLHMISATQGFVIEHPAIIDDQDTIITFFYYHIRKEGDEWIRKQLFPFSIPIDLITHGNNNSLYESLIPLLPRVIDNSIYFVDYSINAHHFLEPYMYDITSGYITKIPTKKSHNHVFVPMLCGDELCLGGAEIYFLT